MGKVSVLLTDMLETIRNAYYSNLGKRVRYWRWKLLRKWGRLGKNVRFYGRGINVSMPWTVFVGDEVSIHDGVIFRSGGRIEIGDRAYIGHYCVLSCSDGITIGEHTMLGPHVVIVDGDHGIENCGEPMIAQPMTTAPVVIGKDCWICANVTILKGVTINEGAVIGAGSVVTTDIPAGAIAAGVPAKVKRFREGFGTEAGG